MNNYFSAEFVLILYLIAYIAHVFLTFLKDISQPNR